MPQRGPHSQTVAPIHWLDDACLVRILNFLTPMPDRFSAARVCRRWQSLASDPRMWLRVDPTSGRRSWPGVFETLEDAVAAARRGETILLASGVHVVHNIHIRKPICLVGGGASADDTVLLCPRGFESALEFSATGRVANLTIKAELGSCLLHREGRLTVDGCALKCGEHPLEHLSCPIISTAGDLPCPLTKGRNGVSVMETRIEGGVGAVQTSGGLKLQQVRVMCGRAALTFWFTVSQLLAEADAPMVIFKAEDKLAHVK